MFEDNNELESNSINFDEDLFNETIESRLLEVSYEDNFVIMEIKRDCNINEYMRDSNIYVPEKVEDDIFSTTLLDCGIENIRKKKIYIFSEGLSLYNVFSTNDTILINEKIKNEITDKVKDQTIIKIDKLTGNYKVTRINYNKGIEENVINSFAMKYGFDRPMGLNKDDAMIYSLELLKRITNVANIENIINLNLIYGYLNIGDNEKNVADTTEAITALRKILKKTI